MILCFLLSCLAGGLCIRHSSCFKVVEMKVSDLFEFAPYFIAIIGRRQRKNLLGNDLIRHCIEFRWIFSNPMQQLVLRPSRNALRDSSLTPRGGKSSDNDWGSYSASVTSIGKCQLHGCITVHTTERPLSRYHHKGIPMAAQGVWLCKQCKLYVSTYGGVRPEHFAKYPAILNNSLIVLLFSLDPRRIPFVRRALWEFPRFTSSCRYGHYLPCGTNLDTTRHALAPVHYFQSPRLSTLDVGFTERKSSLPGKPQSLLWYNWIEQGLICPAGARMNPEGLLHPPAEDVNLQVELIRHDGPLEGPWSCRSISTSTWREIGAGGLSSTDFVLTDEV